VSVVVKEISGRIVRQVRDEDSMPIIDLIGTTWAEYPGCVLDVDGEEPWMRAPATYYAEHGGMFWVAVGADGALHGCVGCREVAAGTFELKSLYVAAAGRRGGLGAGLVRLVEETAVDGGAGRMVLWSDGRFIDAHRLYTRLGYQPTGESRELNDLSNTTEFGFAKELPG
jgi:GNAT superfamily N-acetyltransferase